jgi:hypothetical protein
MASIVDICNSALNQLGASTILSLTEDSKNARLCNARYASVRDAVFRSHTWNCLQKRASLASDVATPSWGFEKQFTLPSDCLRLITILDSSYDYRVEGRKIVSNLDSMKILYVARVEDPNEYDELLKETISAALAADIAYAITSSNPVATQMYNLYQTKLKDARFVDATEGQNILLDNDNPNFIDTNQFLSSRL